MDYYAGIDVSLKESSVCIVDGTGKVIREVKFHGAPYPVLDIGVMDDEANQVTLCISGACGP